MSDLSFRVSGLYLTVSFIAVASTTEPNRTCQFIVQSPIPTKKPAQRYEELRLQVADFDDDHLLDVVYAKSETHVIELFLGYENNSFKVHEEHLYGEAIEGGVSHKLMALIIADLNHDYHLDLIWRHDSKDQMDIGYGYGNGSFQNPTPISNVNSNSDTEIAIGDLNNDTYADLVAFIGDEGEIVVYLGMQNGSVSIAPNYRIDINLYPWTIVLADFNSDGTLDLVYTANDGALGILLGVGDGSFQLGQFQSTPSKEALVKATPCDVNEDGMVDIVFVGFDTSYLLVMLNDGNGTFREGCSHSFDADKMIRLIEVGNINNDDHLDIAIVPFSPTGIIKIYSGFGNGSFAASNVINAASGRLLRELKLGDFNGDHRTDLLTATSDALIVVLNDC